MWNTVVERQQIYRINIYHSWQAAHRIEDTNMSMDKDFEKSLKELNDAFTTSPHYVVKEQQYFHAYVALFDHLRNTKCTFVEIGILGGGSLFMWRNWLGPDARIVGIDLNPEVKKWQEYGFEIYVGDQGDPAFVQNTLEKIGGFDALLDDGGHQSFQQVSTLLGALKSADRNCVIAIEDTSASFMKDFSKHGSRSFLEYAKSLTDVLVSRSFEMYPRRFRKLKNHELTDLYGKLQSIEFFSGIVGFNLTEATVPVPQVIQNMDTAPITDFRYEGMNSLQVTWPLIFKHKNVRIRGGKTFKNKLVSIARRVLKR